MNSHRVAVPYNEGVAKAPKGLIFEPAVLRCTWTVLVRSSVQISTLSELLRHPLIVEFKNCSVILQLIGKKLDRMKSRVLIVGLVAVCFAGLGAYFSNQQFEKPAPSMTSSEALSEALFTSQFPAVSGSTTKSLAEYRNKFVVVNFWATWCAPCVQEMPELSAMQTEFQDKGINFIGIGIDTQENMAAFAQKYKITYPLFVGGMSGTKLSTTLGNNTSGLPYTVILNKAGKVVKSYRGKLDMAELRKDISAQLAPSS